MASLRKLCGGTLEFRLRSTPSAQCGVSKPFPAILMAVLARLGGRVSKRNERGKPAKARNRQGGEYRGKPETWGTLASAGV